MVDAIRLLTAEELLASARAAAEQCIPLREANHHEPGSRLWHRFNAEYRDREAELHSPCHVDEVA